MGLPVIAVPGPAADDRFELVEEVERLLLGVLATPADIRSLVAGQCREQLLAQGPEPALERPLVGGLVDAPRLDRDTQPGAGAQQVLRQVDLAVIDLMRTSS